MALPHPVFTCGLLYSVLVTVSESRYLAGSAAISFTASDSSSALTAQVLVILKYFICLTTFPPATGLKPSPDETTTAGKKRQNAAAFSSLMRGCLFLPATISRQAGDGFRGQSSDLITDK